MKGNKLISHVKNKTQIDHASQNAYETHMRNASHARYETQTQYAKGDKNERNTES